MKDGIGWNSASVMTENFFRTRFSNPQPSYESGAGCWYWPMAVGSPVNCSMRAMDVQNRIGWWQTSIWQKQGYRGTVKRTSQGQGRWQGQKKIEDMWRYSKSQTASLAQLMSNMAQPCCPCSEFPCPRRGTIVDVVLRQTATPSQAHSDGFQAIRELRCISGRPGRPHWHVPFALMIVEELLAVSYRWRFILTLRSTSRMSGSIPSAWHPLGPTQPGAPDIWQSMTLLWSRGQLRHEMAWHFACAQIQAKHSFHL